MASKEGRTSERRLFPPAIAILNGGDRRKQPYFCGFGPPLTPLRKEKKEEILRKSYEEGNGNGNGGSTVLPE